MKQIEYTEKQKIVLEVLEYIDKYFGANEFSSWWQRKKYFDNMQKIKKHFGIEEQYLTLREYITKHTNGSYHKFVFEINGISFNVSNIHEFLRYYNELLLDQYYVISVEKTDNGGNCENYVATHKLTLVLKED